jgi:L-threonylcarbamoyladenylate synthase
MTRPVNPWHLRQAIRALGQGGIVACPTEGVFGLHCNPFDSEAVFRLLEIKQRPVKAGLILIAASFEQIKSLLKPLPRHNENRVFATWPGAVTWLWPADSALPFWIRGNHGTVAVRVTNHPILATLCQQWGGPLISTSANPHGRKPARSALQVRNYFNDRIDFILHGRLGDQQQPTEIRDARDGAIIRPGQSRAVPSNNGPNNA